MIRPKILVYGIKELALIIQSVRIYRERHILVAKQYHNFVPPMELIVLPSLDVLKHSHKLVAFWEPMEIADGYQQQAPQHLNVHFIPIVQQQLGQQQLNANHGDLLVFLMEPLVLQNPHVRLI